MAKPDPQRIKDIINDPDYRMVIEGIRAGLISPILAVNTTDETRAAKLAELHALDRIQATLTKASKV